MSRSAVDGARLHSGATRGWALAPLPRNQSSTYIAYKRPTVCLRPSVSNFYGFCFKFSLQQKFNRLKLLPHLLTKLCNIGSSGCFFRQILTFGVPLCRFRTFKKTQWAAQLRPRLLFVDPFRTQPVQFLERAYHSAKYCPWKQIGPLLVWNVYWIISHRAYLHIA